MANETLNDTPRLSLEEWKEINENIRHWESLVFENAKHFFSVVSLTLGGAGAVSAWTSIPHHTRTIAIGALVGAALLLSIFAFL